MKKERITPDIIQDLKPNEIFVFGSNLMGLHGLGAAQTAFEHFGAVWGKGTGHHGQTYAIPTKDRSIKTLAIEHIESYVFEFILYAQKHPELLFLVTPVGTGLAGHKPKDIAPMFEDCLYMENVYLPKSFLNILNK